MIQRFIAAVFFIILVAVFIGCSGDKPRSKLPSDAVILAFGDSLTDGKGVERKYSYPSVLAELTGLRVINAGVSGEVTKDGLQRLPGVLRSTSPHLLVLLEGGNDILRNQQASDIKKNIAQMIELAQTSGIEVILLGVPKKSLFSSSAPLYRELAQEYDVIFDEKLIATLLRSRQYKSDAIHFNKAGYRVMAENIEQLMSDHGL
ncbi:MAG: GDSL-type esterase/lipase family protein [Pseudomonadales bacterium]